MYGNPSGDLVKFKNWDLLYTKESSINVNEVIDYDSSVIGTLDVSNSEDFPLDLSYTISDGKNLENRFGDFSHTFDIPATKKNNQIFNNVWRAEVSQEKTKAWGIKKCTVNVDGTPFFDGEIQIKKSSHDVNPKSYSCTLYGGNFSWMGQLKDKSLCEVFDETVVDFEFTYAEVEETWLKTAYYYSNPTPGNTQSIIQYPLISYRDFNIGGAQNHVNMDDDAAGARPPEFQPSFYVISIFEKIFRNIGYEIESDFIYTEHFTKLVCNFPFMKNDFKDIQKHYSSHQVLLLEDYQYLDTHVGLSTITNWHTCILSHNVDDPSQSYDNATGVWTCQMAGNYDVYSQLAFLIWNTSDLFETCPQYVGGACDWQHDVASPSDSWAWGSRVKHTAQPLSASPTVSYVGTASNGFGQSIDNLYLGRGFWQPGVRILQM